MHIATDTWVLVIFGIVYAGMIAGRLPWLALDRTGIALTGAIAMLAVTREDPTEAAEAFDIPTLSLLFGLMIVSAQFRVSGFYTWVAGRVGAVNVSPQALLLLIVATVGLLSALLTNDVIALATAPLIIEMAALRGLNPVPYLLGIAAGANIGSAATLVGNPQNILIGESLDLSFPGYMSYSMVPAALGLIIAWGVLAWAFRGKWEMKFKAPHFRTVPFNMGETLQGIFVLAGVIAVFLFTTWPRDLVAIGAAGVILINRKLTSRTYLEQVDWHLLVLFAGLFVVNDTFRDTGALDGMARWMLNAGADLHSPGWLFAAVSVLSNLVSNVPAVMLLLPFADHEISGPGLALFSTLVGNLIIVSSIANIIVIDQAARLGIKINWVQHARTGVPITLLTLLLAGLWLWLRLSLP